MIEKSYWLNLKEKDSFDLIIIIIIITKNKLTLTTRLNKLHFHLLLFKLIYFQINNQQTARKRERVKFGHFTCNMKGFLPPPLNHKDHPLIYLSYHFLHYFHLFLDFVSFVWRWWTKKRSTKRKDENWINSHLRLATDWHGSGLTIVLAD